MFHIGDGRNNSKLTDSTLFLLTTSHICWGCSCSCCTVLLITEKMEQTALIMCLQWKLLSHSVIYMQMKQDCSEGCIDSWNLWGGRIIFFIIMLLFIHWLIIYFKLTFLAISTSAVTQPTQPPVTYLDRLSRWEEIQKAFRKKCFPPLQQIASHLTLYGEASFPMPRSPS